MPPIDYLHHYTSIESLALILSSKKIRFTRLDQVDDLKESDKFGEYHLSQLLFVSCWTDSNEENIALWNMYSKNMKGVRISLPKNPFKYKPLTPQPGENWVIKENSYLLFSFDEMFASDYFVMPIVKGNDDSFIKKVTYLNEEDLKKIRAKAVSLEGPRTIIEPSVELAGYKLDIWKFQEEVRYVICIVPVPEGTFSRPLSKDSFTKLIFYFDQTMKLGIKPNLNYYDVSIDQEYLDNLIVTLGPYTSNSDRIIAESLLTRFTKNGEILDSELKDKIREKK